MATNLRDLLGLVTTQSLADLSVGDSLSKVPNMPSTGMCVQYIHAQCGAHNQNRELNAYNFFKYEDWTVPVGVTEVVFEMWAAGGGGGNSCCCAKGTPGSSGAYGWKKLSTHAGTLTEGDVYQICIGPGGCGNTGTTLGAQGCKSYITGNSLTNFCVDGGWGGCSCCWQCCCKWSISTCGICANGCCALYHGADGGHHGIPAASIIFCYDNHCHNKQVYAYPAGLLNGKGGYLPTTQCENSGCGLCMMQWGASQLPWGGSSEISYIPGMGGTSAWTCGGGCCCGMNGNPGMVRISYKYSTNV
tara:strand:- start:801 stop:1706 length:906 start_codon:yes stop_codon:yes gene_type:complete